jgi:hypothetical protein
MQNPMAKTRQKKGMHHVIHSLRRRRAEFILNGPV